MIKTLFIPAIFFLVPSFADAGNCIISLHSAETAETFSSHHPPYAPGETGNDLYDVIKPIDSYKVKKTSSSTNTSFLCSTVQFFRPPKKISPDKNVTGRIPSIFPATVLLI